MTPSEPYLVDPNDPRAPPEDVWDAMSAEERARVVDALPSELDLGPPEGDLHRSAKERARDPLQRFFERIGRRVYLSSELPVYYPAEPVFAPDLLAVVEVEPHPRERWVVADEQRGLDFVLEINVKGHRRKDLELNVERYARLGIHEYFVFEPARSLLRGFALPGSDAGVHRPMLGQAGRFASRVLGLDLRVEGGDLRFYYGDAAVPETREVLAKVEGLLSDLMAKYEEATARAEEEARLRTEEARLRTEETERRERAEARLAEALAQLERLGRGRGPS